MPLENRQSDALKAAGLRRPPATAAARAQRWLHRLLALVALLALALEFGFEQPPVSPASLILIEIVVVSLYVLSRVITVLSATGRAEALRAIGVDLSMVVVIGVVVFTGGGLSGRPVLNLSVMYVAVMQIAIAARLFAEAIKWNIALAQRRLHPTQLLVLSFLLLIVVGTVCLSLPRATHRHVRAAPEYTPTRHVLNCLFTATSATCVTGLVVYDTGRDFTLFGQTVILILMQCGGLGIMIFGSAAGLLIGQSMSVRQTMLLQDMMSYRTLNQIRSIVYFIVIGTFVTEAVGAAMLYPMWHDVASPARRLFYSVFHAVSAFCNAGFSFQADSLISYRYEWQVYGAIMPLVVIGGLGFPVLYNLLSSLRGRLRLIGHGHRTRIGLRNVNPADIRLSLHTRIALLMTAALLVIATGAYLLLETWRAEVLPVPTGVHWLTDAQSHTMHESTWGWRLADAAFLSVAARTAGFNTVAMDPASLSPGSHLLTAILMFVGGAPASTAGGAKITTIFVLLLGIWSTMRGRSEVRFMRRTIPDEIVRRAAVVASVMVCLISAGTLVLCHTENVSLLIAMFEVVSATATTGLSTGLTGHLTDAGKTVIIVLMFAGRIGPVTLLVALAGRTHTDRFAYPEEGVGIG